MVSLAQAEKHGLYKCDAWHVARRLEDVDC